MYPRFWGYYVAIVSLIAVLFNIVTSAQQVPARSDSSVTSTSKYALGHILVKFRGSVSVESRAEVHALVSARTVKQYIVVPNLEKVELPSSLDVSTALRAYRGRSEVEYAEPDYTVHLFTTSNDSLFPQMWNLLNTGQNGGIAGDDVAATLAWNLSTGDHNVIVATLDTGIDYTHPDLIPNLFHNTAVCNGVNDNTNGCYGISAVQYTSSTFDDNGHGTHVAGIIGAAGNNNIGVVGINWNVQLLTCKFLNSAGSGQVSDAISCLDYILQMKNAGYNIVASNNSWGGRAYSQALTDAIQAQQQAGILFIAAAGNNFSDNDVVPTYPANTALSNVIAVAASTRTDDLAGFSNTGQHTVHLAAPGQEIVSTLPGHTYGLLSGTSMATPEVTGAVALLAAQNPSLDWRGLKNLILAGGDSRPSLGQTVTGKRLNLNGSMTCSGKTVESRLQPANNALAGTAGVAVTLEAINVDCAQPAGNVVVTVSPGGQTVTLIDDGTGGDQVSGDGIYTAQWTPPAKGNYSLSFPDGDVVQMEILGNYVAAPTFYNYVNIAGTNLNLTDDSVAQITSPFAISFGGGSFSNMQVGSNGTISFTDASSPIVNKVIPGHDPSPVTLIAPFWQDLYPVAGSAQNVYWTVVGSAPNRQLVVEWRNVRSFACHSDSSATVTFEVVFSESKSSVLFEYANTTFGDSCSFQDAGGQATVGVQVSPKVGAMWSINDPVIINGSALLWTLGNSGSPNNPVPTITSISPATAPIGGQAFTLTVNGSGFIPTSAVNFFLYDRPTTYISSTQLKAEIPAEAIAPNAAPSVYVYVDNPTPGGGESNFITFPLSSAAPTITSISPTSATAGSFSFSLTVNGSGFSQTQSAVYWNGTLLQGLGKVVVSPNQMIVGIPYTLIASSGTAQVTVINAPPGGGISNPATFTILSATQSPVYLQQQGFLTGHETPATVSRSSPTRFLGWKYAQRGGQSYLNAFSRPRAQAPLPAPSPALFNPIGDSSGSTSLSLSGTPALAGLQLRSLLPADFIPTAVAAGDFNSDGIPDWVVSNGGSNNLWVYLGSGNGTFSGAIVIPLSGQSPLALAVADLRGNGRLDIVVAEADSGSIGVLLGNGNGTFGVEKTYFVPGAPISLALADMNQDGHVDVVTGLLLDPSLPLGGAMVTLIGDGIGNLGTPMFEPYLTFGVQVPESIAVADFEKNGKPDVIVVDPGEGAFIYVNDGSGLLKESRSIQDAFSLVGLAPITATAGDVNEDGCPDAVIFDNLGITRVFPGNCDSTFQTQSTQIGEADLGWAAALVDLNGDGHLDLVYSGIYQNSGGYGQTAGNLIGVSFGDGKGNFGAAHVFRGGQTSFALAVADFNRDGHPDIIAANQDSDSASMFLNDGAGGFGTPNGGYIGYINGNNSSGPVNAPFTSFIPADVDGDGKPDLVLIEVGPGYPNPFQATVMLNDGTGHFGPPVRSPIAEGTSGVTDYLLGDFRHTGKPDLVTISSAEGNNPRLVFAPNTGGGSFGSPGITKLTNVPVQGTLAAGDFNHDGNLDLAVASSASQNGTATITIYVGHGDGTFSAQAPTTFNTNNGGYWIQGLWVGDFNGDGKLDLLAWVYVNVTPAQNNDVYELMGNGDGTFSPAKLVIQNLSGIAVADFNHDGCPDVVDNRAQFANYPELTVPQFRIFLCQPDGSFQLTNTYAPYTGQSIFQRTLGTANGARFPAFLGDFNGDGNVDLAAIQLAPGYPAKTNYVQFLLGNGDGSFTPTYQTYVLNSSVPSMAFDMTGDGRADMAEVDGFTSSFQLIPGGPGPALQLQVVGDPVIGTKGSVLISLATLSSNATQVTLSASDPAISIPTTVTIPAGALTQEVNFTIGSSFNSSHVFWLQATLGSSTATAYATQATAKGQYGVAVYVNNSAETTFAGLPTADYQLGINSLAGYSATMALTCHGLPAGASCQFGTTFLTVVPGGGASTSLLVTPAAGTPVGTYPFTIQGSNGTITASVKATLAIGDFRVSLAPSTHTALQNATATYTIMVSSINGYSGNFTGTCSGIPAPAVCTVSGGIVNYSANIQTNSLAIGNYSFTVNVSNGVATRSATAQLGIGDFNGTLSANSLSVAVGKSADITVNLTGQNGFVDPITLTCSGAPSGSNCAFSPSIVTPSSSGASATMTVTVVVKPKATYAHNGGARSMGRLGSLALSGIFLGACLIIASGRSKNRSLCKCLTLMAMLGLAVSCGGGGSGSGGGGDGGGGGGGGSGSGSTSFNVIVQGSVDNVTKNLGTVQVMVP
jgi:subtilisin family serine protease